MGSGARLRLSTRDSDRLAWPHVHQNRKYIVIADQLRRTRAAVDQVFQLADRAARLRQAVAELGTHVA